MNIPMVALKPQTYAGRRVAAGAEFTVRGQSDARLLLALGRADFAMAHAAPEPEPEPVAVVAEPEAPKPKPKRQYRRRDMTAESAATPAADSQADAEAAD
jgi:hypothetical protein